MLAGSILLPWLMTQCNDHSVQTHLTLAQCPGLVCWGTWPLWGLSTQQPLQPPVQSQYQWRRTHLMNWRRWIYPRRRCPPQRPSPSRWSWSRSPSSPGHPCWRRASGPGLGAAACGGASAGGGGVCGDVCGGSAFWPPRHPCHHIPPLPPGSHLPLPGRRCPGLTGWRCSCTCVRERGVLEGAAGSLHGVCSQRYIIIISHQ